MTTRSASDIFRNLTIRDRNSMGAQKAGYSMCLNRIIHYFIFIFAFASLVMCPSVHHIGENIQHDITVKLETKTPKQNPKRNLAFNPLKIVTTARGGISVQFRMLQELPVFLSAPSTLNLSRLSTIRLLL